MEFCETNETLLEIEISSWLHIYLWIHSITLNTSADPEPSLCCLHAQKSKIVLALGNWQSKVHCWNSGEFQRTITVHQEEKCWCSELKDTSGSDRSGAELMFSNCFSEPKRLRESLKPNMVYVICYKKYINVIINRNTLKCLLYIVVFIIYSTTIHLLLPQKVVSGLWRENTYTC